TTLFRSLLAEGARVRAKRPQLCFDQRDGFVVEAGADVRSVSQAPVVPVADQDGAERSARALARRIAADHELGALRRLDLEPRARALPRLVAAVLALADHTLEAARHRGLVQRHAILGGVHELHERRRQQALREVAAAVGVLELAQVDTLEVDEVEAVENGLLRAVLHRAE